MLNKVIRLESRQMYPSIVTTSDNIFLSSRKDNSIEEVLARKEKNSMLSTVLEIPLESVQSISFHETSGTVKVKYINEKQKLKKRSLVFNSEEAANRYGQFLGQHIGLKEHTTEEKKIWQILKGVFFLALSIGFIFLMATIDDASALESNREGYSRSARNAKAGSAILQLIYTILGSTGSIALGSLISLGIIYFTYRRLQNPKMEIEWTRS